MMNTGLSMRLRRRRWWLFHARDITIRGGQTMYNGIKSDRKRYESGKFLIAFVYSYLISGSYQKSAARNPW